MDGLLAELGLEEKLRHQMASTLSGGEKRRCEVARALVTDPKFLLLDEPFVGIDPLAVADLQSVVGSLKAKGIGVLITDHNVRETLQIVDRAYIVYEGQSARGRHGAANFWPIRKRGAFISEKNSVYKEGGATMQVNITARHLKLSTAISDYVQKKLEKAKRFLDHLIWAQVVLDVSKTRHLAEIIIHAAGHTFTAKEESADLYAAIDLASDNIDEQLRRYKDRHRERTPEFRRGTGRAQTWSTDVGRVWKIAVEPARQQHARAALVPLSVNEAISAMEHSESAHWIFLNKENRRVTVVYRKPDKTYGVVESIS